MQTDENNYQESAKAALDSAIAEIAGEEYARLSGELSPIVMPKITEYALKELDKLQDRVMPNYDRWVAPFYISWYQPGQINLAYSMIADLTSAKGAFTDAGNLHVVDFGCGALAMQFGVALAAADAIRNGQTIAAIQIDCLDASPDMISVGVKLWERFKSKVNNAPDLAELTQACDAIASRTDGLRTEPQGGAARWLSAMHAVYASNKDDVRRWLQSIHHNFAPDTGFLTTHRQGDWLLPGVSPFNKNNLLYNLLEKYTIPPKLVGGLPVTTGWRSETSRGLTQRFPQAPGIIPNFLDNPNQPVNWERQVNEAAAHIYTRR